MKDNIKPEDLHAVNTKSFGDIIYYNMKILKLNKI